MSNLAEVVAIAVGVSENRKNCWANLTVQLTPLSGGDSVVRSGSAISILRKQADGYWVMTRDANMLTLAS
jgi:ketosteroid isomerase-like protein